MANDELRQMLAVAVAAAEDKKAEDVRVLQLDPADSGLTDYFLLLSGSNPRQIQTIADEIELQIKHRFGQLPNSREGYKQAEWVLLDYVDFVVHIFSKERREYYGLERLRKTATHVASGELRSALAEKTVKTRATAKQSAKKTSRKKVDEPVKAALAKKPAKKAAKAEKKATAKKSAQRVKK